MSNISTLTRNGLMAIAILATPLLAQTNENAQDARRRSEMTTTSQNENHSYLGWISLLGLVGLAGIIPNCQTQSRSEKSGLSAR